MFVEPTLFAKGAALKAEDYLHEHTSYPFVCICEGKLKSTVAMEVVKLAVAHKKALVCGTTGFSPEEFAEFEKAAELRDKIKELENMM